ncbi:MAG: integrin alpha [Phycisphaerales bacterium]
MNRRPRTTLVCTALGAPALLAAGALAQFQGIAGPVSVEHEAFGRYVATVPDIDGDGVGDVAVGTDDPWPGLDSQRVFLYSGRTGAFLRSIISVGTIAPFPHFQPQHFSVAGLAGLKDVNGDGRGDIAVADAENRRVLVFSGATGERLHLITLPAGEPERAFGTSVGAIDDLDGDGRGDFIVGAPIAALTFLDNGAAYIFSGATGAVLRTIVSPPIGAPIINGDPHFGSLVTGTPDLDGDSLPDALIAGAYRVSLISGTTGNILRDFKSFPNAAGFGRAIAWCPDADGDSIADVIIGAPLSALDATPPVRGQVAECGRAYLYSGATGALLRSWKGPTVAGNRFGWSVAGAPDLTGDGRGDVIIGAPINPDAFRGTGYGPGRVYVYSGATGAAVKVLNSPNAELGGAFGIAVTGLPDTNTNGRADIFIGAPHEDPGSANPFADRGRGYFLRF